MKDTKTTLSKKHKLILGSTAVLVSAAIVLTGTFAWTSISQEARNEMAGLLNPGGRLHDDFNGENKDVYVENFMNPEEGGEPIFARIRLDEYMEMGPGAGLRDGDEGYDAKKVTTLVPGSNIDDVTTWKTHIPGAEDDPFHEYFDWKFGGSTVFMPTFNKNKDSLAANINGTFEGTTRGDKVYYDDYETYTIGQRKTADAVYDADANDTDEGTAAVEGTNIQTVNEEHTAKETLTATVMTMAEWKAKGSIPGPYWVYDVDGWAYWAQAIQPGEATGLLLDQVDKIKIPSGKWYYSINVVGQFATADDFGNAADGTGFFGPKAGSAPTDDAMALLNQAATTAIVAGGDGKNYISYGDNTFRAIKEDNTLDKKLICGGLDEKPGTEDDRTNVIELKTPSAVYGSKLLGPEADSTYYAAGPDRKLGTADDVVVDFLGEDVKEGIRAITPGSTDTVTIDGVEFYVLAKQDDQALLFAKGSVAKMSFDSDSNIWQDSAVRAYLNGEWLDAHETLKMTAVKTTLHTRDNEQEGEPNWIDTEDRVFLLSQADVTGRVYNKISADDARDYTCGTVKTIVPSAVKKLEEGTWLLRSPGRGSYAAAGIGSSGSDGYDCGISNGGQVRPALWVSIAP